LEQSVNPTEEQQQILELSRTGLPLKIDAYAGTGKTTTLNMIARDSSKRGHYLAFNKAIASDASRRFPQAVTCTTNHSVAFRAVANQGGYNQQKMT
jgi:hypothetical protein